MKIRPDWQIKYLSYIYDLNNNKLWEEYYEELQNASCGYSDYANFRAEECKKELEKRLKKIGFL